MAVTGSERVRLDSWKSIAEYLGRDVRTVVRWEKEKGLPVHTVPGLRRRSVFAYADELDSWLAGSPQMNGEADASAPRGAGGASSEGEEISSGDREEEKSKTATLESWIRIAQQWNPRRSLLVFAGAGFAALLVMAYLVSTVLTKTVASSVVEKVTLQEDRVVAWKKNGSEAWSYDLPQGSPRFQTASLLTPVGEIVGEEFLVNVAKQSDNADTYLFFNSAGRLLWKYSPQETLKFGKESFPPPWSTRALHHLTFDGDKRVALALTHHTWWPSMLVLLDPQGRPVGKFVNSGWITSVNSFTGPHGPLLLAGGASNSHDGAMIAFLDAHQLAGSSPEEKGSPYECRNCGPGRPLKYFVFPRSELNIATGSTFNFAYGDPKGDQLIVQTVEEDTLPMEKHATAVYEFSNDLQLLRASFGNRYWDLHRKLEIEGRIMHSKVECPDRYGPRTVLSWDPQNGWKELHPN